jgi:hypothetical protein
MKASMAEFGEPKKVNMQINILREKLWEAVPDSVKEIPWKKAEKTLMERLLFLGQKALKWTLIVLFVFSSLSDVIFSISSNQELMIPLGLFVGCLMTDFLKEISHELFRNSEVYFSILCIHSSCLFPISLSVYNLSQFLLLLLLFCVYFISMCM